MIGRRGVLAGAAALAAPAIRADLPEVVSRIRSSVVPVGTYRPTDSPRFGFRGTGFAVGDGRMVATNFHVLPEATPESEAPLAVLVLSGPGSADLRRARVVATDRTRDLALLRIDGAPLAPLMLDAGDATREGQSIALMGFPIGGALGFTPVTHRGIVAALTRMAIPAPTSQQLDARAVTRLREGNFDVLQLDATAYPGNSGGPVFDATTGHVIGVVNMVLVKSSRESALSQPTGISYAVPARHVLTLLAEAGQPGAPPQTR